MSRTRSRLALAALPVLLLTGACTDEGTGSATGGGTTSGGPSTSAGEAPRAEIVKSGFGQRGAEVFATALVKSTTEGGATVTVRYEVKDKGGAVLATEEQVERFARAGQVLAVGRRVEVPDDAQVASVDATLDVEKADSDPALPDIEVGPVMVTKGDDGDPSARFGIRNPTAEPLDSPRIGVICYDQAGAVIGGQSETVDTVAPNGIKRVTSTPIVSGTPARCEAFAGRSA